MNYVNTLALILLTSFFNLALAATTEIPDSRGLITTAEQNETWNNHLKEYYFAGITVTESDELFDFTLPYRAEEGAGSYQNYG